MNVHRQASVTGAMLTAVYFQRQTFFIEKGENLHTLSSYKYPVSVFQTIAKQGGFTLKESFVDDDEKMTIHVMQVA